jgi:hypothetical protein
MLPLAWLRWRLAAAVPLGVRAAGDASKKTKRRSLGLRLPGSVFSAFSVFCTGGHGDAIEDGCSVQESHRRLSLKQLQGELPAGCPMVLLSGY